MPGEEVDFLDIGNQYFADVDRFTQHISDTIENDSLDGKLSIIGSVSDFTTKSQFKESIETQFEVRNDLGDLLLATSKNRDVPFYIHMNDGCPLFFTTGTKTKDIPKTVGHYIRSEPDISRMWIGKRQMEDIRVDLTEDGKNDVLVPYITAHYSPRSDVDNVSREGFERTIQYYGDDGLRTYKELHDKYGVFPTNIQFKKPGVFKFRITQEGIFTINKGGVKQSLSLIKKTIDSLKEVKRAVNSAQYEEVRTELDTSSPRSEPWKIKLSRGLEKDDVNYFRQCMSADDWEFGVTDYRPSTEDTIGFTGEVVDKIHYGQLGVRTRGGNEIRVYPREKTGFGQSIRFFSFISNNIDKDALPVTA